MIRAFLSECSFARKNPSLLVALFVLPALINLLLGFVFIGGRLQHIPIAVTDLDNSSTSRMITEQFRQCEEFDIKYYPQNQDELQAIMDKGLIRAGLVIPKGFSSDVISGASPALMMIYDGSHLSVASTAKSKASELLLTIKAGVQIKMLESKLNMPKQQATDAVKVAGFTTRTLNNPAKNFAFFMNPGLTAAAAQSALVLIAAVCMRKEDFERPALSVLGKVLFYSVCGTISLFLCIVIQNKLFHIPFKGSYALGAGLCALLSLCASSFAVFTSALIPEPGISMIINAVLFIPCSILGGYTWPAMSMPPAYQKISFMMPFAHFGDNIRLLYLKGAGSGSLQSDIIWMAAFSLGFTALGMGVAIIRGLFRAETESEASANA